MNPQSPATGAAQHSLLLAEKFLPHAGGSRIYYYHLYRDWAPDRVTILTKKVPGWREFDERESNEHFRIVRGFTPLRSSKTGELPKAILPLAKAYWIASRDKIDVVHCGDLFPCGVMALALKRSLGIPYIVYCHGEEITLTNRFRFQPRLRDHIYQSAALVITNSEASFKLLRKIGVPAGHIRKITPGVDCERFRPASANAALVSRYGIEGASTLLTVARLVPRKGHDMVLRAVAVLRHEFSQLKYVIVGAGPEEKRLKTLAEDLGIRQSVILAGLVPEQELADHYRLCDVMVMPNREQDGDMEGFGMTFLEAAAAGKPVIGGRSGGAGEAVIDGVTGLLVDPNSLEELVSAIRKILLQPGMAESMGKAGEQRARVQFNWETRARELREITREVANSPRARRRFAATQAADLASKAL